MEYAVHILTFILISTLLSQSYNMTFGLGGHFNLAHIASYALGAYTTAILSTDYGMNFELSLCFSALAGGCFSVLLCSCARKLEGDYFALATLAMNALVISVLINWRSLTHGVLGISGIPRPLFYGQELNESGEFFLYLTVWTLIVQALLSLLYHAPFARFLRAIKCDLVAAESNGINSQQMNFFVLCIGSAVAALAGGLFASFISYIDPSSFQLGEMVFVLSVVVLGGPGNYWGCIFATFFLCIVPELLRFIELPSYLIGPLRQVLYGTILYVVLLISKENIFPIRRNI
jgi:branched-chain amino acid transport system permease protein